MLFGYARWPAHSRRIESALLSRIRTTGRQYGTIAIPRIWHEVIVSFLEGDPDSPYITGCLYHADKKPPYELPVHKTRTVFKSLSTPGKEENRGFNELRVEDKSGEEEIYVHAEKDVNIHVKNDWKEHILHDRHQHVGHDTYTETVGETHISLKDQRKTELFADDNQTLYADRHVKVDGKWLGKAGQEIHVYAGEKIVIEAGSELTIKAGGSWLKLNAAGVHFGGATINIAGGGSPGEGTEAEPLLPMRKKITKLYWSYGDDEIPITGRSRFYVDLNLHIETENYQPGNIVEVFVRRDDEEPLYARSKELSVRAVVLEDGTAKVRNVFSGTDLTIVDETESR